MKGEEDEESSTYLQPVGPNASELWLALLGSAEKVTEQNKTENCMLHFYFECLILLRQTSGESTD